jgi:hypothetical protein
MPIYTFYLCNPDGSAISFETFELTSDRAAGPMATRMLMQHLSCAYVVAWEDQRPVLARYREEPAIRPLANASERRLPL